MTKQQLSINEMKKIAHDIIDTELEDIPHDTFPMTFIEFNKSFPYNNKSKLKLVKNITNKTRYKSFRGANYKFFNDNNDAIVIALDNFNIFTKIKKLTNLVFCCYHEARHVSQVRSSEEYINFFSNLDLFNMLNAPRANYRLKHDKFFFEIDANKYGVKQAKKYLKEKYPKIYNTEYDSLNILKQKYELDYIMFNPSQCINTALKIIEKKQIIPESCQEILRVFINDNGTFKPMNEIINNPMFKKLDSRITSAFLSNATFLKNINLETLSKKELQIINVALNHTKEIHEKQKNSLEKSFLNKIITQAEYQESLKSLYFKFDASLSYPLNNIIKQIVEETEVKKSIKTNEQNIENVNKLIKKRSKGYLAFDLLYIIGIIITLITITFIITH